MKFSLTYDVTITHTIEVEAESLEQAQGIMEGYEESEVIADLAERLSTMDISGAAIDKVCALGEDGSELYY